VKCLLYDFINEIRKECYKSKGKGKKHSEDSKLFSANCTLSKLLLGPICHMLGSIRGCCRELGRASYALGAVLHEIYVGSSPSISPRLLNPIAFAGWLSMLHSMRPSSSVVPECFRVSFLIGG
jgi:hypothetical protein